MPLTVSHTPAAAQRHFLNCLVPGPRTSLQPLSTPPGHSVRHGPQPAHLPGQDDQSEK